MKTIYEKKPDVDKIAGRRPELFPDIIEPDFWRMYDIAKPYSMLHISGFYNLYCSIRYLAVQNIPGDFVECGVWYGGASAFTALARDHFGLHGRKVHLYDTFAGFPEGSEDVLTGGAQIKGVSYQSFLSDVEDNLRACGVDLNTTVFREGPVEGTLKSHPVPDQIGVLRLDTDFYSSTRAEMDILYPRLNKGGVLIVDDYGLFQGARKAVDETLGHTILLTRVDKGVRSGIKP